MNMELASGFLQALGRLSAQAAVLVLLVLLTQWMFCRWLTPSWRCALWLLVVGRLLLPVSLPTRVSVFNLVPASPRHNIAPGGRIVPAHLEQSEPVSPLDTEASRARTVPAT